MGNSLMKLLISLGVDSSDVKRGLDDAEKQSKTSAANIGKSMMGIGSAMTVGLTAPIAAAGLKAVGLASNLEQSMGGVESVFENSGSVITEFGKTAADEVGLSMRSFNELSTVGGALLQNLGFNAAGAADEMITLAKRGSDVAATFGGPVENVLNAVQSALKGEFNPLEQFGVKMNAAMIEARALEMGLGDVNGKVDDAAKAQAALAIFYEQTAKTQGQFARESDTLAGQQERLKAKFENTAAALGTQLLPIGLKIMQFVSELVDKFQSLTPEQQKMILVTLGIVAAIGPLVTIIGGLVTAFGAVMPILSAVAAVLTGPVGLAILAIIAIIALLKLAWDNNFGGIQEKTAAVFAIIRKIFDAFKAAFNGDWTAFGELLREAWDMYWTLIVKTVGELWSKVGPALKTMADNIINFFKNVDWKNLGMNIIIGIGNGIASMGNWLADKARAAAQAALAAAKGFLGIRSPSKAFAELGKFSAMGFGLQFEKSMAGFAPQMAMSMSVPAASVATPAGNGISSADLRGMKPEPINYPKLARSMRDAFLKETQ